MKQVYEKPKQVSGNCPWHSSPIRNPGGKTCKAKEKVSKFHFSPIKRTSKESIPSPMLSPSTIPTLEKSNSLQSNDRVFTWEDSGRSFNKRSLESTVYKGSDSYQTQLIYMQQYITYLKAKLSEFEEQSTIKVEPDQSLQEEIEYLKSIINAKNKESDNYLDELNEKDAQIFKLSQRLTDLQEYSQENYEKSLRRGEEVMIVEKELKNFYSKKIFEYETVLDELKNELDKKDREVGVVRDQSLNRIRELEGVREEVLEKVEKNSELNEKVFKDIEEKVLKTEGKLYSLTKTVRFLQNSALLPSNNKLKALEEEITSQYENLLAEQRYTNEKLIAKLEKMEENFTGLEESYGKLQELVRKYEEDLKKEVKLNEEFAKQKFIMEQEVKKSENLAENEKIEKILALKQGEELSEELRIVKHTENELKKEKSELEEIIKIQTKEISAKSWEIEEKDKELERLSKKNNKKKLKFQEQNLNIESKSQKIESLQSELRTSEQEIAGLLQELQQKRHEIELSKQFELEKTKKMSALDKLLLEKAFETEDLNVKIRNLQSNLLKKSQESQKLSETSTEQLLKIESLNIKIEEMLSEINEKDEKIQESLMKNTEHLIKIEKSKNLLNESRNIIAKHEDLIKTQNSNFELLSKNKENLENELFQARNQIKVLESAQQDHFSTINEYQTQLKKLNNYIEDQEKTMEKLKKDFEIGKETHESSMYLLTQNKVSALKEAREVHDQQKNSDKLKIQNLESHIESLNNELKQNVEKNEELINLLKLTQAKQYRTESQFSETHQQLLEEISQLKNSEARLKKELGTVHLLKEEVAEQVKIYENELVEISQQKSEILELLQEKEASLVANVQKHEQMVDQFEQILEKNAKIVLELEQGKKELMEKWSLDTQEGKKHEKELLIRIESLQNDTKMLKIELDSKALQLQEGTERFTQSEFRLNTEIHKLSTKLNEKQAEIKELKKNIDGKEEVEKGLKANIVELKGKIFEDDRIIYKNNSDIEGFKEKLQEKSKNEEKLKEKLKISEEKLQNSLESCENLEEKLKRAEFILEETKENLENRVAKLLKNLEQAESTILLSETRAETLSGQLENLSKGLLTQKQEKSILEVELQDQKMEFKQEIQSLEIKLSVLNRENLELSKSCTDLKSKLESAEFKLENHIKELAQTQEKLEKTQRKEKSLKDSLENTIKDHESALESLKLSHKQQKASILADLNKVRTELSEKVDFSQSLLHEIESQTKKEELLSGENQSLLRKMKNTETQFKILLDEKQLEVEKLEKYGKELKNQVLNISETHVSEANLNSMLKKINLEAEKNIQELAERVRNLEEYCQSLESDKESLEMELKAKENDLQSEQSKRKVAEKDLASKKTEIQGLAKNISEIKEVFDNELSMLDSNLLSEKQKNDQILRELTKKQEEFEDIQAESQYLKVKLADSEDYLHKINSILNEEKSKNRQLEEMIQIEKETWNQEKALTSDLLQNAEKDLEKALKKTKSLTDDLEELKTTSESLYSQNKHLKSTLASTEENLESLYTESLKYKERLDTQLLTNKSHSGKLKKQGKIIEQLEDQEFQLKSFIDNCQNKIQSQEYLISKLSKEKNSLETRNFELESDTNQLNYIKQKLESVESQAKNLESLNSDLRQELGVAQEERQGLRDKLERALNDLQQTKEVLKNSVRNSEIQMEFQEKMQKHVESKAESLVNQLQYELHEKNAEIKGLGEKLSEVEEKNKDFLRMFPEKDHEKLRSLYKSIKSSGKEILDCEPDKVESKSLKLRKKIDQITEENSLLKEKLSQALLANTKLEDIHDREFKILSEELKSLKLVHSELISKHQIMESSFNNLNQSHLTAMQKCEDLLSEKSALLQKLGDLNTTFTKMSNEKDGLISQLLQENSALKSKLLKLKDSFSLEKSSLSEQVSNLLQQLSNQSGSLSSLNSDLKTLGSELEEKSAAYNDLEALYNTLKKESSKEQEVLNSKLSAAIISGKSIEGSYNDLLRKFSELEQAYESLNIKNEELQVLVPKLQQEKVDLEALLEEFKKILEESGAFDIKELRELVIQLQTQNILNGYQIEKGSQQIKMLEELNQQKMNNYKINVLQNELDQTQQELAKLKVNQGVSIRQAEKIDYILQGITEVEGISKILISQEQDNKKLSVLKSLLEIIERIKFN